MMFKLMSKGAWIVVGVLLLFGFVAPWSYNHDFLKGNVWTEQQRFMEASTVETKVDFLGFKVAQYMDRSIGSLFGCLLIAFVYLAIQNRRIEKRMIDLEERITRERLGAMPTNQPTPPTAPPTSGQD